MARLIKRFRNQPHTVVVGAQTLSICGCGLSANQPYCDATHKICESEDSGILYWYDDAKQRHIAVDGHPDMRSDKQAQVA